MPPKSQNLKKGPIGRGATPMKTQGKSQTPMKSAAGKNEPKGDSRGTGASKTPRSSTASRQFHQVTKSAKGAKGRIPMSESENDSQSSSEGDTEEDRPYEDPSSTEAETSVQNQSRFEEDGVGVGGAPGSSKTLYTENRRDSAASSTRLSERARQGAGFGLHKPPGSTGLWGEGHSAWEVLLMALMGLSCVGVMASTYHCYALGMSPWDLLSPHFNPHPPLSASGSGSGSGLSSGRSLPTVSSGSSFLNLNLDRLFAGDKTDAEKAQEKAAKEAAKAAKDKVTDPEKAKEEAAEKAKLAEEMGVPAADFDDADKFKALVDKMTPEQKARLVKAGLDAAGEKKDEKEEKSRTATPDDIKNASNSYPRGLGPRRVLFIFGMLIAAAILFFTPCMSCIIGVSIMLPVIWILGTVIFFGLSFCLQYSKIKFLDGLCVTLVGFGDPQPPLKDHEGVLLLDDKGNKIYGQPEGYFGQVSLGTSLLGFRKGTIHTTLIKFDFNLFLLRFPSLSPGFLSVSLWLADVSPFPSHSLNRLHPVSGQCHRLRHGYCVRGLDRNHFVVSGALLPEWAVEYEPGFRENPRS